MSGAGMQALDAIPLAWRHVMLAQDPKAVWRIVFAQPCRHQRCACPESVKREV